MFQDKNFGVKKSVQIVQTRTIDENGEIKNEVESHTKVSEREPNYIKIYLDQITRLVEIKGWISSVLYELLGDSKYANEGQMIIINAGYKEMVAEKLKMKPQTVTNAVTELRKKEILIKIKNGVFMLNPQIFGKGEWKDVKKLRYEVEIGEKGTKIKLTEKITAKPESAEVLSAKLLEQADSLDEERLIAIQQLLGMKTMFVPNSTLEKEKETAK